MNIARKIARKAEAFKGGAKKTAGRVTGSRCLQAEGRRDQRNAHSKRAMAKSGTLSPGTRPAAATPDRRLFFRRDAHKA